MKRSMACLIALVLALAPVLATGLYAQARTHDPTQLDLLEGRIVRIDSEAKTFEMRQRGVSSVMWTVAWDDETDGFGTVVVAVAVTRSERSAAHELESP